MKSATFPKLEYTYVPAYDLPESPRTPGFEGSVQYAYENIDGHLVFVTEVFDDLGRVVARSYSFTDKPLDRAQRLRQFCSTVDSEWGMVSFARPYPAPINRYSRVNPQRMKLDPVILAAARSAEAAQSRAGGDEGLRVESPTVAAIIAGQSGSVPHERSAE